MTTRDIEADMKAALVQEYEGYVRAGRKADAEGVAKVLKDQYGHDVAKQDDDGKKAAPVPERADVGKPPEAAVEPKPARAAKRTAPGARLEGK